MTTSGGRCRTTAKIKPPQAVEEKTEEEDDWLNG